MSNIPCERCNGTGKVFNKYHNKDIDCPQCQGLGYFEAYSDELEQAICGQIIASKGKNKGKLKAAYASPVPLDLLADHLAKESFGSNMRAARAWLNVL